MTEKQADFYGAAPSHWERMPLKYRTSHIGSGKTPTGGAEVYQDAGVLFVRSQNVYDDGLRLDDVAFISPEIDADMAGSRVEAGDLLLNITGASIGRSCLVPQGIPAANVNQHVCIVRSADSEESRWLAAIFVSSVIKSQIEMVQSGAGREGLNFEQVGNMLASFPPAFEREPILAYVDRETASIDALIAKKTRFIELLREKRQALIMQAVTKGLDPEVAMKDSGIEWLGRVPAHWRVSPLQYLVKFISGGTPSKENLAYWNGDIPWASAKDMKVEVLCETQDHLTDQALTDGAATLLPVGSVLVVVRGMILARTFPVCVVGVTMAINQDIKALLPSASVTSSFLAWLLRGTASLSLSRLEEAGHGTKALRMESWIDIELPVPPVIEQATISMHIESQTSATDRLIERTSRSIELLRERRAALITAAVSGQIDVREPT